MISFDFKVKINDFEEKSVEKCQKVLMKSMFKMEELAVRFAPVNESELVNNITLFPQILSNNYVLTSKSSHSAPMEFGTRPFYAKIKPLKKWASKKLGDENAAYAVRAKIAKVGIKAHPFMRPAFYQVSSYWLNYFAAVEAKKFT